MDGRLSIDGSVFVWREHAVEGKRSERVLVHALGTSKIVPLEGFDGFNVLDISTDGELIALRGSWGVKRNNNVAELVVLHWRSNERVFASKDHLYFRALFDATGTRALIEVNNKKNVCINLQTGESIGETNFKHSGLLPVLRDSLRNWVWLPPLARKKREIFDFESGVCRPAPALVDAVSPKGSLYRIDESLTRLGPTFEPLWSRPASERHASGNLLTANVSFCGDDDVVVYEHPDPKGGFGVLHSIDASTGKEIAKRQRERGEPLECAWPGRFIIDTWNARTLNVDDLTWQPLPPPLG